MTGEQGSLSPLHSDSEERYDNRRQLKVTYRWYWLTPAAGGIFVMVVGVLLLESHPVAANRVLLGYLSIVGGVAIMAVSIVAQLLRRHTDVASVSLSDLEVRFISRNGTESSARWDTRPLFFRLWHATEHPPGTPVHIEGHMLEWGKIQSPVSDEIFSALLRRAHRLGLQVSRSTEKLPGPRGPPSIIEIVEFRAD